MSKYLRRYELVIGEPYIVDESFIIKTPFLTAEDKLNAVEDSIRKAEDETVGYKITDHQITFTIVKTTSGETPNEAKISVYNLSNKVVDYLDNLTGKKSVVMLKTAYGDDPLKMIFIGSLEKYKDTWTSETRVTDLSVGDASVNYSDLYTSRLYKKGTSIDTIVEDLIGDINLPKAGGHVVKTDRSLDRNMYFSGNVYSQLSKLAIYYDYNFSIQDGVVFWMPIGIGLKKNVSVINSETGLIGEVTSIDSNDGISQNNTTSSSAGISFKILMDGNLLPENTVKLESRSKTGFYKIRSVKHTGDFEGSNWFTEIEAEETKDVI